LLNLLGLSPVTFGSGYLKVEKVPVKLFPLQLSYIGFLPDFLTSTVSPQTCTATAYGLYNEGGWYLDQRCTASGATCSEAISNAEDCRNQKICARVRAHGLTPSTSLGCKQTTFEDVP